MQLAKQLQTAYSLDFLDAVLIVEGLGFTATDRPPDVAIERRVTVNGVRGVQFAVRDWEGETFVRTSLEWWSQGGIIDITEFPKSLDEADQSMRDSLEILATFRYL